MKLKILLLMVAVIGILFIAGCSASGSNDYYRSAPPSGGGCGVAAPAEPVSDVVAGAVEAASDEGLHY